MASVPCIVGHAACIDTVYNNLPRTRVADSIKWFIRVGMVQLHDYILLSLAF